MPSTFPWSPVIRESSWNKTEIEEKDSLILRLMFDYTFLINNEKNYQKVIHDVGKTK